LPVNRALELYAELLFEEVMKKIIDNFQLKMNQNFAEFTLATSCAKAGLDLISKSNKEATVSLNLGDDLYSEPVTFGELLTSSSDFLSNSIALYQNIMIASWSDLLDDIFSYYVCKHFKGEFEFTSLKKQTIKLDFSSSIPIEKQVSNALINEFSFKNYADRFKIINTILNLNKDSVFEEKIIKKHVLIRNAIQHHNGIAYSDMFKLLGVSSFSVLDSGGEDENVKSGEKVYISVPEFDLLKRSLHLLTQNWRNTNA
jgi:hypothetical protein